MKTRCLAVVLLLTCCLSLGSPPGALAQTGEAQSVPGFRAGSPALLYLAENQAVTLFDPAGGQSLALTGPQAAASFWPSPSGERLVYNDRLLSLLAVTDGNLTQQEEILPAAPDGGVSWSPDEQQLAFRDAAGQVWVAAAGGDAESLPQADTPPVWSYDGAWLAYCGTDQALWVGSAPDTATRVAEAVSCPVIWSPQHNLLAYGLQGELEPDTRQTFVYDPQNDQSTRLLEGGAPLDWSPDGSLLAMTRVTVMGASAFSYRVFIADPTGDRQVEAGEFHSRAPGLHGWAPVESEYIFAAVRVAPDLSGVTPLADWLLAATRDGQHFLAANGDLATLEVSCQDAAQTRQAPLVTVDLNDTPGAAAPGIWGQLSGDGQWAAISDFQEQGMNALLIRCDASRQAPLPTDLAPDSLAFSDDSRWLLGSQFNASPGQPAQVILYDLESGATQSLPAGPGSRAYWVSLPTAAAPAQEETFAIEGQVTDIQGEPLPGVEIQVEGEVLAQTGADGQYEIQGLAPGMYMLVPSLPGMVFEPEEFEVRVPPNAAGVDFRMVVPGISPVEPPGDVPELPQPVPPLPAPVFPAPVPTVPLAILLLLLCLSCGGLLGLGLIVAGVVLVARRRDRPAGPPPPPPPVG